MKATFKLYPAALGTALFALATQVHAAVPTEVTSEIADMKTNAIAVATAVLVAIIAVMAVKFIRKGM